jgi:hypothetical protein
MRHRRQQAHVLSSATSELRLPPTNLDPSGSAAQHTSAWAAFMPLPPPTNRPQIAKLALPTRSSRPSTAASFSGWAGGGGSSSEVSRFSWTETPRGATQCKHKPFVQSTPRRELGLNGERARVSSLTVGEVQKARDESTGDSALRDVIRREEQLGGPKTLYAACPLCFAQLQAGAQQRFEKVVAVTKAVTQADPGQRRLHRSSLDSLGAPSQSGGAERNLNESAPWVTTPSWVYEQSADTHLSLEGYVTRTLRTEALDGLGQEELDVTKFSKSTLELTLHVYSKNARALTFENVCVPGAQRQTFLKKYSL